MKRLQEDLYFISGITFLYVNQLRKEMPIAKATANRIASQPGYSAGKQMCISKTRAGKYRLFVRTNGEWADASLKDIE